MFEDLFVDRCYIARYRAAPLLDERLSYLRHCAEAGSRPSTLRRIAVHQINLVYFLDLHEGDRVSVAQVEAAAGQWCLPGGRRSRQPALPRARQRFLGHAVRWLRFMDILEEPDTPRHAHVGEVAVFEAWMREEQGWSEDTICGCLSTVDCFFDGLDESDITLAAVEIDTSARVLHYFSRHVGENTDCGSVADADVLSFLAGNGQLTRYRANKYSALTGFYRYAISRGYAERSPLPASEDEPRKPRSAPHYVYSHDELQRLFGAIDLSRQRPVQLDADTLRALLLVLYGAGLRFGEAQRLTLEDVDLIDAVLTIRNTKFFKTRSECRRICCGKMESSHVWRDDPACPQHISGRNICPKMLRATSLGASTQIHYRPRRRSCGAQALVPEMEREIPVMKAILQDPDAHFRYRMTMACYADQLEAD